MDIVFVPVALAGFALAALYVRGCDRIVGRDQRTDPTGSPGQRSAR
ncbi:MAG: hypothetical protein KIT69_09685 [Propionibacteriaceae bacterium]|nr:hypothetical protein [Propionibacteriaceae bacterium]